MRAIVILALFTTGSLLAQPLGRTGSRKGESKSEFKGETRGASKGKFETARENKLMNAREKTLPKPSLGIGSSTMGEVAPSDSGLDSTGLTNNAIDTEIDLTAEEKAEIAEIAVSDSRILEIQDNFAEAKANSKRDPQAVRAIQSFTNETLATWILNSSESADTIKALDKVSRVSDATAEIAAEGASQGEMQRLGQNFTAALNSNELDVTTVGEACPVLAGAL